MALEQPIVLAVVAGLVIVAVVVGVLWGLRRRGASWGAPRRAPELIVTIRPQPPASIVGKAARQAW